MKKQAAVDLHIHSCLSPCSDDDMTPNNVVNMAILNGLDAIAVTDHNSCENIEAVVKAAGRRIIVIPGMELQTKEEIHVLCYFKSLDASVAFHEEIAKYYDEMPNTPEIFGNQLIMNHMDELIGQKKQSLLTSLNISIEDAVHIARSFGGAVVPAHINRPSFSIISQLGFIPQSLNLALLEFSQNNWINFSDFPDYKFITSSDSHNLGSIFDRKMLIAVDDISLDHIFDYLIKPF